MASIRHSRFKKSMLKLKKKKVRCYLIDWNSSLGKGYGIKYQDCVHGNTIT